MRHQVTERAKILYLAAITCGEQCDHGRSCHPGQQSPSGSKVGDRMNCLNEKFDFLPLAYYKLLSQNEGISVNKFHFLKFAISVRCGHFDYRPQAQKGSYVIKWGWLPVVA